MGSKKIAIDSHELRHSLSQKSGAAYCTGRLAGYTRRTIITITGVKKPPSITNHEARLRFFLIHSLWKLCIKMIAMC
jgi:hypothetical protein